MEEKQNYFVLISIVAIVAVVGIVALVISITDKNSMTLPDSIIGPGGDLSGQAGAMFDACGPWIQGASGTWYRRCRYGDMVQNCYFKADGSGGCYT